MTTEQPTRPARPPRPGPAFRRAALGLPPDAAEVASTAVRPGPAIPRETLREALARIPDLEPRDPTAVDALAVPAVPAVTSAPGESSTPDDAAATDRDEEAATGDDGPADGQPSALLALASRLVNGPLPARYELAEPTEPPEPPDGDESVTDSDLPDLFTVPSTPDPAPGTGDAAGADEPGEPPAELAVQLAAAGGPDWLVAAAEDHEAANRRRSPATERAHPVPLWRRIGFGVCVTALIAAIPVLGLMGYRMVSESTDGEFISSTKKPTDPGYEEEVISTPTQLLLHNDAQGRPVAATVLSLSGVDGGGAVIYVPLDTEVRKAAYGVDRIIRAYDVLAEDDRAYAVQQVAMQIAAVLNVGLDSVVEVDDRGWAQLVGPVAPLTLDNPDPVEAAGTLIDSGRVSLTADQVGPYLAATVPGETPINRYLRHELLWNAWMEAVAAGGEDAVPGERTSGIGLFARSLAAGPVTYSVVPVSPDPEIEGLLLVDYPALNEIVLAAVPSPDPAYPGSRPTVRLLNGVSPDPIPGEIIQTVVQIGGSVAVVGNGPTFGRDETTVVFADPANEGYAELLVVAMGGGTARHDPEADEAIGLTVILGSDVVDGASVSTTATDLDSADSSSGSTTEPGGT